MAISFPVSYAAQRHLPLIGCAIGRWRGFDSSKNPVSNAQNIAMLQQVGAKVARVDLPWAETEMLPGVYSWGKIGSLIDALKAAGIKVVAILGSGNQLYTANWYSPPITDGAITAFGNWAKAACLRFGGSDVFYEIINEPNLPQNWYGAPDAKQWAAVVNAAATGLKQARDYACVVTGGLAISGTPYMDFLAAAMPYLNTAALTAIGFHPYTGGDLYLFDPMMQPEHAPTRQEDIRTSDVVKRTLPVWNTEQGFYLTSGACIGSTIAERLERQAQFATRFVLSSLFLKQKFAIWYGLFDNGTNADAMEEGLGLFDFDLAIKPAGVQFAKIMKLVNACTALDIYKDGPNAYRAVFHFEDGSDKIVVWSSSGAQCAMPVVREASGPMVLETL